MTSPITAFTLIRQIYKKHSTTKLYGHLKA